MNDFTKEELEIICQFFNIAIEDYHEPDSTYHLRDKIQSMIKMWETKMIISESRKTKDEI